MLIFGVGWIFGFFVLNKGIVVFEYVFVIVNGFQVSMNNIDFI